MAVLSELACNVELGATANDQGKNHDAEIQTHIACDNHRNSFSGDRLQ